MRKEKSEKQNNRNPLTKLQRPPNCLQSQFSCPGTTPDKSASEHGSLISTELEWKQQLWTKSDGLSSGLAVLEAWVADLYL